MDVTHVVSHFVFPRKAVFTAPMTGGMFTVNELELSSIVSDGDMSLQVSFSSETDFIAGTRLKQAVKCWAVS